MKQDGGHLEMIFVVLTALGLILGGVHIAATKRPRTRLQIADILLLYLFIFPIGLGTGVCFRTVVAKEWLP